MIPIATKGKFVNGVFVPAHKIKVPVVPVVPEDAPSKTESVEKVEEVNKETVLPVQPPTVPEKKKG